MFRVLFIASLSLAATFASASEWLVLSDLTLIDGTGAPARSVSKLVVRDGIIVSMGEEGLSPAAFDVVTEVSVNSGFVIPGLIDSHVHLSGFPGDRAGMEQRMQAALRGGITSVRDMAGDARVLADTQRAILRGEFTGLTVAYAALFGGETMFADPRVTLSGIGYPAGKAPWLQSVTRDTDLSQALANASGTGAVAIKIYGNLERRTVRKLTAAAHAQDLQVWAHATVFPAGPDDLLSAGVDVMSHAPYLIWAAVDEIPGDYSARRNGPYDDIPADHPKVRAILKRMAATDTLLDTTLVIFRDAIAGAEGEEEGAWGRKAFLWGVAVTRLAHELGVPLAAGTDRFMQDEGSLPDLHEELAILVNEAGLQPMNALLAATRNAARAAGIDANRGTLVIGKAADLLVLDSNPLTDIAATKDIRMVLKDGQIVINAGKSE